MARLRYDNIFGTATGNPITCPSGAGTATLASAPGPGTLPAVTGSDFIVLIIEPGTVNEDIRYAQYSGSGTSLTVGTAQEGTTGISHSGVAWAHGPTAADFASGGGSFPTYTGAGSPQGVQASVAASDSYLDTTNGGIYFAGNPMASSPNAWQAGVGTADLETSAPVPGIILDTSIDYLWLLADGTQEAGVAISDTTAAGSGGSFNGIYYASQFTDGDQSISIRLGAAGAFTWGLNADGSTDFPGALSPYYLEGVVGPYTLDGSECIVQGHGAITLPAVSSSFAGFKLFTIKDDGTGTLVLHTSGSDTIDGSSSSRSFAAYEAMTIIGDFSHWYVVWANAGAIV